MKADGPVHLLCELCMIIILGAFSFLLFLRIKNLPGFGRFPRKIVDQITLFLFDYLT